MPGDVLQVDILEVKMAQDWGYTAILPLLGGLPPDHPHLQGARTHTHSFVVDENHPRWAYQL
ncbi:hypothetical protein [Yoonia sp.]|jgi:acetamidase/formamidase|uniref:hypothetical protein n=1 Tax=Yoonia sp. TaxID=2212373 RepID=UPI00404732FA